MHLIDTETLELHEFFGEKTPSYAILSHRWEDGEVSFKEFQKRRNLEKQGWHKIRAFCKLAREHGHGYAWVDTCCIDKSSSAGLQETINSMFNWYHAAQKCYVYLCDVPEDDQVNAPDSAFRKSQWFTRGWTLQELLAPRELIFISREWNCLLGTREELTIIISDITGILSTLLNNFVRYGTYDHKYLVKSHYGIATIMSWAAKRKTTRPEDASYCLLGLFGVQMPLLYGEGSKAFRRLQIELIDAYDDDSIYLWDVKDTQVIPDHRMSDCFSISGLVASLPADFANSRDTAPIVWDQGRSLDRITSRGIETERLMYKLEMFPLGDYFVLPLNRRFSGSHVPLTSECVFQTCLHDHGADQDRPPLDLVCIYLRKNNAGEFHRFHVHDPELATRMDAQLQELVREPPALVRYHMTVRHEPERDDLDYIWSIEHD